MNDAMWYYFFLTHENIEQIKKKEKRRKLELLMSLEKNV